MFFYFLRSLVLNTQMLIVDLGYVMSRRERRYRFIEPTDEPFTLKGQRQFDRDFVNEWAIPVMQEIERYFSENPDKQVVKISQFPNEIEDKTIEYTAKGKTIRRTVKRPQRCLPFLAKVFRDNPEYKEKYKIQIAKDGNTINVYKQS